MPTAPKKKIAKKAAAREKAHPELPAAQKVHRVEFGSENHAMRTIQWGVDLGLVPKSVYADACRASDKGVLIECLERVRLVCLAQDYNEQAKRIEEMQASLKRTPE